jgi:hypothetical protein
MTEYLGLEKASYLKVVLVEVTPVDEWMKPPLE